MALFPRPRVVVSRCLGFAHCRYNGLTIASDEVERLKPHVDFRPVCPELELGLGVPRNPLRIVVINNEPRLMQTVSGRDLTEEMRRFADSFLSSIGELDGFILKSRSPSCGIKDVKLYSSLGKEGPMGIGRGLFGDAVLERFPHLAVEDEGRLTNFRIREHFLTKLFALARFREVRASGEMQALVQFQAENKLLLMAYNQGELAALGRIVANPERRPFAQLAKEYEARLWRALARMPRYPSMINVLMHSLGYFSERLSSQEKAFFLEMLARYREGKIPLSVPQGILRSWAVRFEEDYLLQQTFFQPYPEELVEITDSGKGR